VSVQHQKACVRHAQARAGHDAASLERAKQEESIDKLQEDARLQRQAAAEREQTAHMQGKLVKHLQEANHELQNANKKLYQDLDAKNDKLV
jgi:hypothetical protein